MEACGIIAEYNPLHNGHIYHMNQTKKQTGLPLVIAMSGSFVQRGEPAILDKFTRASLAVAQGADLVLELPAAFSLRSAQYFAAGATDLLQATGIVSCISCGAEHPEYPFQTMATAMLSSGFQAELHELISQGHSYASACSELLGHREDFPVLREANDILALEYTKALLSKPLKPIYLQRIASSYNGLELNGAYASATAIRSLLLEARNPEEFLQQRESLSPYLPETVWNALVQAYTQNHTSGSWSCSYKASMWRLLSYQLLLKSPEQLQNSTLVSEGLENLLYKARTASDYEQAVSLCIGKRYPANRIRRLFCQLLLDLPREYYQQTAPAYLRVLAFNDTGRQLLKVMKEKARLPIITKLGNNPFSGESEAYSQQLQLDIRATGCWSLLKPGILQTDSDFLVSPAYIHN